MTAECVLGYGIIASADFQRALARAYMQAGFAKHFAFEDQLADKF